MMKKNFKYQFDESTGILYKYYYGKININDIYSSWDYALENNLIPKEVKGIVLDYQESEFEIPIAEHGKIAAYYQKHIDIFRDLKIAILSQKPQNAVIPSLVTLKDDGYQSRLFYTLKSAIAWILN